MSHDVRWSARVLVVALPLAAVLLALDGPSASADGGCGAAGRPACTLVRPAVAAPVPPSEIGGDDCIVAVGGLGSTAESTTLAFERLIPRGDGVRVSVLEYDSLGKVAAGAEALRDHVASIAADCAAVHVVAHSMGGVVADRAFSMGLAHDARIATYLPLASPHNGSTLARAICGIGLISEDVTEDIRELTAAVGQIDPTSAAICDLARVNGSRAARDVATARLRLVTDPLVPRRDHAAPYRDVRELLPDDETQLEGHGGILQSARVRDVVGRSIADHRVPPDDRDDVYRATAEFAGAATDGPVASAHRVVGQVLWGAALVAEVARFFLGAIGVR